MRNVAKSLKISERSVRCIVRDKLRLTSCRKTTGHYLLDRMKQQRKEKCAKMLAVAERRGIRRVLFTDEKVFSIEPVRNRQNDRVIRKVGSPRSVEFARSHFPAKSVMVWAGVCSTGKTKLIFVEKGVKINSKIYQDAILKAEVARFAEEHFKNDNWILQQDWAPAHGSKSSMEVARQICPMMWGKNYWPSNSPDLNPMNFAIWGMLEKEVSRIRHMTLESLRRSLERAWDRISDKVLAATTQNFVKRLRACIRANGGHFEQNLKNMK
uniref:DDE_3 domain-containing protein n=1 Tax=Steinernema glaseri TaxID=37863 RepID=A0A1I7Z1I3_9BILA